MDSSWITVLTTRFQSFQTDFENSSEQVATLLYSFLLGQGVIYVLNAWCERSCVASANCYYSCLYSAAIHIYIGMHVEMVGWCVLFVNFSYTSWFIVMLRLHAISPRLNVQRLRVEKFSILRPRRLWVPIFIVTYVLPNCYIVLTYVFVQYVTCSLFKLFLMSARNSTLGFPTVLSEGTCAILQIILILKPILSAVSRTISCKQPRKYIKFTWQQCLSLLLANQDSAALSVSQIARGRKKRPNRTEWQWQIWNKPLWLLGDLDRFGCESQLLIEKEDRKTNVD